MSLTKDYFAKALAKENGYPLNQSVELIETLLELIKFTLASSGGRAYQQVREVLCQGEASEKGQESEDMMLAARRVVTFKCSGQLRDKINNEREDDFTQRVRQGQVAIVMKDK
jgi:integration host factor subunit alpha